MCLRSLKHAFKLRQLLQDAVIRFGVGACMLGQAHNVIRRHLVAFEDGVIVPSGNFDGSRRNPQLGEFLDLIGCKFKLHLVVGGCE